MIRNILVWGLLNRVVLSTLIWSFIPPNMSGRTPQVFKAAFWPLSIGISMCQGMQARRIIFVLGSTKWFHCWSKNLNSCVKYNASLHPASIFQICSICWRTDNLTYCRNRYLFNLLTYRVKPLVIQSFLTFDSMYRTLKCDHSLESCWAVLYCGAVC